MKVNTAIKNEYGTINKDHKKSGAYVSTAHLESKGSKGLGTAGMGGNVTGMTGAIHGG